MGGIVSSEFATDPYASDASTTTTTEIVAFSIVVNGVTLTVVDLDPALAIFIPSSNPTRDDCRYYNTNTNEWDTAGVTKTGNTATHIICATTHLTSFAGIATSSALAVATSTLVLLLALVLQLIQ